MPKAILVTKQRKEWVDVLRALAMIMVIYGHLLSGYGHSEYYIITSPIKIPLFFVISGYVFNINRSNPREFFTNLTKKLIVPLLLFSIILMPIKLCAAYYNLVNHSMKEVVFSFITGNELWYLPCCIIAEIIFYFVIKLAKKEMYLVFLCLGISTVGFILSSYGILSTANCNTALIAQLFLLIGFYFRRHEEWFEKNWLPICVTGSLFYILLCIASFTIFPGKILDVHLNAYYCIPINILSIIAGNTALMCLGRHFSITSTVLSFIGKNTLTYYVIHEYVVGVIRLLLHILGVKESGSYLFELGVLIAVCLVCAAISCVINKYCPFLVGKSIERNKQKPIC